MNESKGRTQVAFLRYVSESFDDWRGKKTGQRNYQAHPLPDPKFFATPNDNPPIRTPPPL